MANEVTVLELNPVRSKDAPVREMPPIAVPQVLTIGGAVSSAFNRSTTIISVYTTTACNIEIGASPDGTRIFPLPANQWHDFGVLPNHKIKATA